MRALVWQWGRRGAGPRYAAELARSFARVPGTESLLSLATGAELLRAADPPRCDLPFPTYAGIAGFALRALRAPLLVPRLSAWLRAERVDVALCAMPAPLDLVMAAALRRAGVPFAVVVHDADPHPGDGFPLQMRLQRRLLGHADGVFALSTHVADRLRQQGAAGRLLMTGSLPPFAFGEPPPPPGAHGGPLRLLSFGRLLPYKGLDLLADGLDRLGAPGGAPDGAPGGASGGAQDGAPEGAPDRAQGNPQDRARDAVRVRVVGSGPQSPVLDRLRAMPGVTVENRWVPEDEIGGLLAWADALVLSHREASQSGVAAAAIAARRWIVATRVGGLEEQLSGVPAALLCDPDPESLAAALRSLVRGCMGPPAPSDLDAAWQLVSERMAGALAVLRR